MFNAAMTRIGVALQSRIATVKDDEKGATAVEYGLIVGLIAVVIIAAVTLLGTNLNGLFGEINDKL